MYVTCLDLEGVLVPEIWIEFAKVSGIEGLKRTTRDESDYDKLMHYRIDILKEHNLGLKEIKAVIENIKPMEGAKEFLDELRSLCQVIILSDTFTQFATPLMKKLGMPTIFCNELIAKDNIITGYVLRIQNGKFHTINALKSIGFDTIAAGDSYNDVAMINQATAGFLFRTTLALKQQYPCIKAYETYDDLLLAIKGVLAKNR